MVYRLSTTFNFNGQSLNCIIDEAGNPLFRADDVCEILEFANARDALANHVDGDDVAKRDTIDSLGRIQPTNHVNESGLYSLIFGSKKPAAKSFKRWVTSDVLPTIRKTGAYAMPTAASGIDYEKLAEALSTKLDILNMSTEITDPRSGNTFNMSFLGAVKSILNHGERLSQLAACVEESAVVSNARAAVLDDLLSNVQKLKNLEHTTTCWQSEMKAMRTRMTKLEKLIAAGVVTE